jgi:hypothetical protein
MSAADKGDFFNKGCVGQIVQNPVAKHISDGY